MNYDETIKLVYVRVPLYRLRHEIDIKKVQDKVEAGSFWCIQSQVVIQVFWSIQDELNLKVSDN